MDSPECPRRRPRGTRRENHAYHGRLLDERDEPQTAGSDGLAEVIDGQKWLTYDGTAIPHISANSITTGTFDWSVAADSVTEATNV